MVAHLPLLLIGPLIIIGISILFGQASESMARQDVRASIAVIATAPEFRALDAARSRSIRLRQDALPN